MNELRLAVIGAGFWARYQLAAWQELKDVRCVAVCDRVRAKAEALARERGIPITYDDAEEMLERERPDLVDVITDVNTHERFVRLAAKHKVPVICQKPMAPDLDSADAMVAACAEANVPFAVHENWRWQAPLRELKRVLDSQVIGRPFRARIDFISSFPVFDRQPSLRELEQFILTDIGSHVLDTARFLFGEAASVYAQTHRIHQDIRGEDVATVLMPMGEGGTSVVCQMSYASRIEHERFPETLIFIEGEHGSAELAPDYWIRVTEKSGTHARRVPPPFYPWADPRFALVQSSMVDCQRNLLDAVIGGLRAESHAADNLETMRLIFAAYESARENRVVAIEPQSSNHNTNQ
ncbi:MAG: Gfo/Idh/MocA family oxidoreductase [Chthoniobacteraceae bacterium]